VIELLQHVAIDVDDLPAAIAFYRDILGLTVAPRPVSLGDNGIWFELGNAQLHLVEVGDFSSPRTAQHFAMQVADTNVVVEQLRALGVEVTEPFDIGAGVQAFFRDPAGNLLELNQPV
jgi:catechol 2,3-dioxygenase-like lactoylglutathione lyase family enzyme